MRCSTANAGGIAVRTLPSSKSSLPGFCCCDADALRRRLQRHPEFQAAQRAKHPHYADPSARRAWSGPRQAWPNLSWLRLGCPSGRPTATHTAVRLRRWLRITYKVRRRKGGICPRSAPLWTLRARALDRAWARRGVGEGVRFRPRAGCGRTACPVR
jgi:hypothetical protein